MKKSAKADLRSKSVEDLQKESKSLREGMLKARFASALENKVRGMQYRNARRQVARIETLLTERAAAASKKAK
jgi:ribosomal protein L29